MVPLCPLCAVDCVVERACGRPVMFYVLRCTLHRFVVRHSGRRSQSEQKRASERSARKQSAKGAQVARRTSKICAATKQKQTAVRTLRIVRSKTATESPSDSMKIVLLLVMKVVWPLLALRIRSCSASSRAHCKEGAAKEALLLVFPAVAGGVQLKCIQGPLTLSASTPSGRCSAPSPSCRR